jgi:hypothetical protein
MEILSDDELSVELAKLADPLASLSPGAIPIWGG